MNKIHVVLLALILLTGCTNKNCNSASEPKEDISETAMIVDSLLYFRHHSEQTDLLSRRLPDISREQAIAIQLAMLKKELAAGARQVGWKMGGTVADDSASYDPLFGYILDANLIEEDSTVSAENFPGGRAMVEGEIGFVMNRDFINGAESMQELKEGIEYVTNAVEFAQATTIPLRDNPETMNMNHMMASGMGQAGTILGSGKADIEDYNMKNETVRCFINDTLAAEGVSTNVYGGPLHALYSLVNMLPEYDIYLKKGDVVITGSLYDNPAIKSTSDVRLEFSTLGTIHFKVK